MIKQQIERTRYLMLLALLLPALAHSQTWSYSGLVTTAAGGTGATIGAYAKMAVVNGNPAIAFYDDTRDDLVFVRATDASGTSWGTPVIVDWSGNVGQYPSLAVINGNPAISYYDVTNGDLKYVRATDVNGLGWGTPITVVSTNNIGQWTCLLEVNSNPAISYYDVTDADLEYVRASNVNGSAWGSPVTLDATGNVGMYNNMDIVNGNPAVSYADQTGGDLEYVRASDASGSSWGSPVTVVSTDDVGDFTSLEVVNGNPAISYADGTNGDLQYVRASDASGSSWGSPVDVYTTGSTGYYTSLAVVNGNPAIGFRDAANADCYYVRASDASGTTWGSPVAVSSTGVVGQWNTLLVINGNPAISCFHDGDSKLKYRRATDVDGTTWGTEVTLEMNSYARHASVNPFFVGGNPALVYESYSSSDLTYIRAADPFGKTWNQPVVLDATGVVGRNNSPLIVNGNPAIAYYDNSNGDLKYIRANDATGSSWGSPTTLATAGNSGESISMCIVNGNPAIIYYEYNGGGIVKYIRANDANGTSWGSAVTVYSGSAGYLLMTIVNGRPAATLKVGGNPDLAYVRANDENGASWGSTTTLFTGPIVQTNGFAVINGNPAVAISNGSSQVQYKRASDADGTTWGSAVTIATEGMAPEVSLAEVNGRPAVFYAYQYLSYFIKYAYANDATGSSWPTPSSIESNGGVDPRFLTRNDGQEVFLTVMLENAGDVPYIRHGYFNNVWTADAGTTTYNTNGNWLTGTAPGSSDVISIPGGLSNYPAFTSGTTTCAGFNIARDASISLSGGNIAVTGDVHIDGTITGANKLTLSGSSAQTLTGFNGSISNLELNNSSGATISADNKINVTGDYTPTSGTLTTNGGLVLKSTASGTGRIAQGSSSGGYVSGNLTAERYQAGKRCFRFYAHPFTSSIALSQLTDDIDITGTGGASNGFTATNTNNPSAYYWDVTTADNSTAGNNPGWQPFTSATTSSWDQYELLRLLVRGAKGEGLTGGTYTPSAATFEAAGAVNQGDQVITLTKGSGSDFVACGNPFPSGVQMQNVAKGSNVGANYYAWDATSGAAGAYVTNAWSLSYVLPPYSGFFTTVSANTNNTVTFEEADKASGGAALFKGTGNNPNWVELTIHDSTTKWDRLLINFDDKAMSVEDNLDGKKLYNPGLDFFTLSKDSTRLAVDVRPYTDSTSIPLGLTAYTRYNRYVIKTGMYDIPAGTKLYLHDKYLNKVEEMSDTFAYWFDVTSDSLSQGNERFEINMIGKPTNGIATANTNSAQMQLIPNPAYHHVKVSFSHIDGSAQLRLTGITGKVVYSSEVNGGTGSVTIPLHNLPAGIYIAELQGKNARFTQKLVKE